MTTIAATAPATNALIDTGGSAATPPASDGPSIGDRFLTLLVTQLRNQDPLNPMDNAQMTSQLAQISTVTGINKLNDSVSALSAMLGSNQYAQAAGLVGHSVLTSGNTLQLASGTANGGIKLAAAADHVLVTVSDATGRAVRQIDIGAQGAGTQNFAWDGRTDAGAVAADGRYTFMVQATQGGTAVAADALMSGHVDGVVLGSSGTIQLQLGALGRVDMSQIVEIN